MSTKEEWQFEFWPERGCRCILIPPPERRTPILPGGDSTSYKHEAGSESCAPSTLVEWWWYQDALRGCGYPLHPPSRALWRDGTPRRASLKLPLVLGRFGWARRAGDPVRGRRAINFEAKKIFA